MESSQNIRNKERIIKLCLNFIIFQKFFDNAYSQMFCNCDLLRYTAVNTDDRCILHSFLQFIIIKSNAQLAGYILDLIEKEEFLEDEILTGLREQLTNRADKSQAYLLFFLIENTQLSLIYNCINIICKSKGTMPTIDS